MSTVMRLGLFLFILGLFACNKEEEMPISPLTPSGEQFIVPTILPKGDENYLSFDSDYIFDQEELRTFRLELPVDALAQINADPAAEEYVEGMLIFEGDTISPVGIRYKGSVGAFVGCLTGTDWSNPSGEKICTKLSMKVKINWEGREEKFFKLKKLQFHSQNLDNSQLHERLGYWLFRQMGIPAPRSVHARLMINGVYSGLYALTEQIDGRFIKHNFEDDDGNLYKEIWPLSSAGVPFPEQAYRDALKTNEEENASVDLIRTFGQEVADATPEVLQSVIEKYMNIDEMIAYAVVDRMIRNDDGAFHWYCGFGGCSSHNFYWYEAPNLQELHLIPWDLDNAFENIITNANPVTPIADDWGEISNNCQPFPYGTANFRQLSAACDKLTGGWASYTEKYEQTKTAFKNGPFSESAVNAQLDKWVAQMRAATMEAADLHEDAISIAVWENEIEQLKNQLTFARAN